MKYRNVFLRSFLVFGMCGAATQGQADLINVLAQGPTFDNLSPVTITSSGGIQVTFTADGVNTLNSNSGSFGIQDGTNTSANNSDAIGGSELLTLTFDRAVTFDQLVVGNLSGSETAELTIGSNPLQSLADTGSGTDVFNFAAANFVGAGESVLLGATGGDFGLLNFSVSAVPEPSSFAILGLFGSCLAVRRWARQRGK